jgi:ATP-dependent helicase/DNAse subunit B
VPLKLITGPANAGKAGVVLDGVRRAAHAGKASLLVVPTFADATHYERELTANGVVFGVKVLRFERLVDEIARRVGTLRPVLGDVERRQLVVAAVGGLEFEALEASASQPGFVTAAMQLIAELQRSLVDPAAFESALRHWAQRHPERAQYAREVASVYTSYRALLARYDLVDRELYGQQALARLQAQPGLWGATPVFAYGFDDFTDLELAVVSALAGAAGAEVVVGFEWEAERAAFEGRRPAFEALSALAADTDALPAEASYYAPDARAALHHLERRLFEPATTEAADAPDPADAIVLLEAGGERAEAELVAAEVVRLIRDEHVPAERIAVVHRSLRTSAAIVEQVFESYGIDIAVDRGRNADRTPFGRGLMGMLRCALGDGALQDLIDLLRAPGVVTNPHKVDRFEASARRHGVAGSELALARWEEEEWSLDSIHRLRDQLEHPRRFLEQLRFEAAVLYARAGGGEAPVRAHTEYGDAAVLRVVDEALAALVALPTAVVPSPPELIATLAELEALSQAGTRPGAVLVAEPAAVRARRFDAVFVCGLVEGAFPRRAAPEAFLSDDVRAELGEAHGLMLRARDRLADERHLFYAVAARAERRLGLAYRNADEEGNPVVRSPFVDDVCRAFGDVLYGATKVRRLGQLTWPLEEAPTPREFARALAAASPAEPAPRIAPLTGDGLGVVAGTELVSATQLENFARCPVKWFVESVLNPRRVDPDAMPLRRGGLQHTLLQRVFEQMREEHVGPALNQASVARAVELLHEIAAEVRSGFALDADPARSAALVRRAEADCERYLRREAAAATPGFEPSAFELAFGFERREEDEDEGLPALELGDGEVRVRGLIDRIDVSPGGEALVRDYKGTIDVASSVERWRESEDEPLHGRTLQAALYMLAVQRLQGLDPVGGLYVPLRRRDAESKARGVLKADSPAAALAAGAVPEADVLEPEAFERLLAEAEARAVELVEGMRSGELEPCPDHCGWRGGCEYPGICRSGA